MNSSTEELALQYLRYWNRDHAGQWHIADNSPNAFWKFVLRHNYDRQMLHAALTSVATNRPPVTPDTPKILEWFARNPEHVAKFDETLGKYRTPPKSFAEVCSKTYKAVVFQIVTDLSTFLQAQINQY